jgi:hypothetical protein
MPSFSPSACPSSSPEEEWAMAFDELNNRIRHCFTRPELAIRAFAYVQGLMSDASRKNSWQLAEAVGEAIPYALQHLLDRAKWDCDQVRDALRAYIWETLAEPQAVLVVDETGFLKTHCIKMFLLRICAISRKNLSSSSPSASVSERPKRLPFSRRSQYNTGLHAEIL